MNIDKKIEEFFNTLKNLGLETGQIMFIQKQYKQALNDTRNEALEEALEVVDEQIDRYVAGVIRSAIEQVKQAINKLKI